nr:MAG TPA: hypothetical protein [Caudoviricetes sp.]
MKIKRTYSIYFIHSNHLFILEINYDTQYNPFYVQ